MKKWIALILVFVLSLVFLTACSQSQNNGQSPEGSDAANVNEVIDNRSEEANPASDESTSTPEPAISEKPTDEDFEISEYLYENTSR